MDKDKDNLKFTLLFEIVLIYSYDVTDSCFVQKKSGKRRKREVEEKGMQQNYLYTPEYCV